MERIVHVHHVDKDAYLKGNIEPDPEEVDLVFDLSPSFAEVVAQVRVELNWNEPNDGVELEGRHNVGFGMHTRWKTMRINSEQRWSVYKETVAGSQDKALELFATKTVDARIELDLNRPSSPVRERSPPPMSQEEATQSPIVQSPIAQQPPLDNEYDEHDDGDDGFEMNGNNIGDLDKYWTQEEMDHSIPYSRCYASDSDDDGPEEEVDEDGLTAKEAERAEIFKKVTGRDIRVPLFRDVSLADGAVVDGGKSFLLGARPISKRDVDATTALISKGLTFDTFLELKIWLKEFSIKHHRPYIVVHSDLKKRYTLKCVDKRGMERIVHVHHVDKDAYLKGNIEPDPEEVDLVFDLSPSFAEVVAQVRVELNWNEPNDGVELEGRHNVGFGMHTRWKTMRINSEQRWSVYKETVAGSQDKALELFATKTVDARIELDLNRPSSPVRERSPPPMSQEEATQSPIVQSPIAQQPPLDNEYDEHDDGDDGFEMNGNNIGDLDKYWTQEEMDHSIPYSRCYASDSDDDGPEEEVDEDGLTAKEAERAEIFKKVTGRDIRVPLFRDVSLADGAVVDGGKSFLLGARPISKRDVDATTAMISKGLTFDTFLELKIWLKEFSIKHHRPYIVVHSDLKKRYTLKCVDKRGMERIVHVHHVDKDAYLKGNIEPDPEEVDLVFDLSPSFAEVVAQVRVELNWNEPNDGVELEGRHNVGFGMHTRWKTMRINSEQRWSVYKETVAGSQDKALELFATKTVDARIELDLNRPSSPVRERSPPPMSQEEATQSPIVQSPIAQQPPLDNEYDEHDDGDDGFEMNGNNIGDLDKYWTQEEMDDTSPTYR
ncbi:hypothetical protein QYE76_022500 [Lolium multiflorum]|uniref:Uncharacterized protein n=1 Tax=Lolium multiflorum TaxID=4521 RepID=A0AAD8VU58_LOLMU|nr:hypothetical protein QYE76_022500 [Lolium multiflorum]